MARKLKCPECGKLNDREDTTEHKKRYYCPSCLEEKLEKSEKHATDWDELYKYLKKLYSNVPDEYYDEEEHGVEPTGMIYKQLGAFRKPPYNYTDRGMLLTLKYFYETLGNSVLEDAGVGIIAWTYEKAKQNYIRQMKINSSNVDAEYNNKKRYVKVISGRNNSRKKAINLEELSGVDDE